jgi:predicted RNase H-like nuclease (RuvC/YqgF family)
MDNYEINILRRDGNWKKVKPADLLLDSVDQNHLENKHFDNDPKVDDEISKQNDFLYNLNQVNSIISELENLENKKTDLKNELKVFEDEFRSKKKDMDKKIKLMSKEAEMLDKTINIIKNLKNF